MIKKVLSVLISSLIISGSLFVSAGCIGDFTPVLRFVVASDVHIADSGSDNEEKRLAKLFETSYSYTEFIKVHQRHQVRFLSRVMRMHGFCV